MKDINKELDPEEIIEFEYFDNITNKWITVKDKRKVKMVIDEMDKYEKKQNDLIQKYECPIREEDEEDFIYEPTKLELDLESAFQEMVDKISEKEKNSQKILETIKNHIASLSEKQLNVLFLHYFLDFSVTEISKRLNVSKQRISFLIKRIKQKLRK